MSTCPDWEIHLKRSSRALLKARPWRTLWVVSLSSPSQCIHGNLPCGVANQCVPKLSTCDQVAVNSLPECLSNERQLDLAGLDQIENCSDRSSELVASPTPYIIRRQVRVMKHYDSLNIAVTLEVRWDGCVELC